MIFAVIIGTEILNGRREDKHFTFLRDELLKRGYELSGSFIIKDDVTLMKKTFEMIKSIPDSKMFCFGGIGSTPDDYTREVSGEVFSDAMEFNEEFKKKIIDKFGKSAYPARIYMSYLPKGAKLLKHNPINGMCGYYIDDRYFFTPGFPDMAHPMVKEALNKFFPQKEVKQRYTILVYAREGEFVDIMQKLPKNIEFSSLPKLDFTCEISIAGDESKNWIEFFKKELDKKGIKYKDL
jgi:molybdopterin-biosynthesis enzyme MoeA-like protein